MHARLLAALQELTDVRLVAALSDARLGFPATDDLRVFVPDVHLITEKRRRQGGYKYAANDTALLTDVFGALRRLKLGAAGTETVAVYVMGDLLDLWRETPVLDARLDAAAAIRDDHEDLLAAVLDPRLKTRFLLGNHDFDLYRWADYVGWERRYYLPDVTLQAPSTILLHGDVFDWVENLPDALNQVFVYLFAPHRSASSHDLGEMQRLIRKSHGQKKYKTSLHAPAPMELGILRPLASTAEVPAAWNVQRAGPAANPRLRFLTAAREKAREANTEFGMNLRVMFIGHTHHARIAVRDGGGDDFFALVDCGAWIEQSTWVEDGQPWTAPSAQLAALSGNEVRLYQLG